MLGPTTGASRGGMMTGTGHEADVSGTLEAGFDLGWLPEPGRTPALSGRAVAYDDIRRCAYHMSPYGCTLVDGDADGPGLIEICGLAPAEPASVPPETRPDAVTQILDARQMSAATGADAAAEVRKRSANLMTWYLVRAVCDGDPLSVRKRPHHRARWWWLYRCLSCQRHRCQVAALPWLLGDSPTLRRRKR